MNRRDFLKRACMAPVVGLGVLAAKPDSQFIDMQLDLDTLEYTVINPETFDGLAVRSSPMPSSAKCDCPICTVDLSKADPIIADAPWFVGKLPFHVWQSDGLFDLTGIDTVRVRGQRFERYKDGWLCYKDEHPVKT